MSVVTGQALSDFMTQHLPIAQALGIEVDSFSQQQLVLNAPLQPNINDKQSAFGGSIYSVCVMTCWGMVYLHALNNKIDAPNIAVGKAEIKYRAPVLSDFQAKCTVPDIEVFDDFISEYWQQGKAKITLRSFIASPDDPDQKIVELEANFTLYE